MPLRILGLGKQPTDRVEADVYLLTDDALRLLPDPASRENGLSLAHAAPATDLLLDDLRSDDGMGWVPSSAWLTKLAIDGQAPTCATTSRSTRPAAGSRRRGCRDAVRLRNVHAS